jgi:arylsulfatase A-like enzyme
MYRDDGILPTLKPKHSLSETRKSDRSLVRIRMTYDEYVTNLDYELGAFLDGLDQAGILDSSYLIITSDHGEMFERGEHGHGTPLMYEPVTRMPLLVSAASRSLPNWRGASCRASAARMIPSAASSPSSPRKVPPFCRSRRRSLH